MLGRSDGFGRRTQKSTENENISNKIAENRFQRTFDRLSAKQKYLLHKCCAGLHWKRSVCTELMNEIELACPEAILRRCRFVLLSAHTRSTQVLGRVGDGLKIISKSLTSLTQEKEEAPLVFRRCVAVCIYIIDLGSQKPSKSWSLPAATVLSALQLFVKLLEKSSGLWRLDESSLQLECVQLCLHGTRTSRGSTSSTLQVLAHRHESLCVKVGAKHPLVATLRRLMFELLSCCIQDCSTADVSRVLHKFCDHVLTLRHLDPPKTTVTMCNKITHGGLSWISKNNNLEKCKWLVANVMTVGFSTFGGGEDESSAARKNWLYDLKVFMVQEKVVAATKELVNMLGSDPVLAEQMSVVWNKAGISLTFHEFCSGDDETPPKVTQKKELGFFASLREKKKVKKLQASTGFTSSHPEATTEEGRKLMLLSIKSSFTMPQWIPVGAFYLRCLTGGKVYSVLHALVQQGVELLPRLWTACCRLIPLTELFMFTPPQHQETNGLTAEMLATMHVTWSLFAALFAHVLTVIDDNEFASIEIPFPLQTVREVIQRCNTLLLSTIKVYTSSTISAADVFSRDEYGLRANLRRLLRMLLDRSLRVPLLTDPKMKNQEEELWVLPKLVSLDKNNPTLTAFTFRLLSEMPHCIPFTTRVSCLRQFIAQDRKKYSVDKVKYGMKIRRSHCLQDGFLQFMKIPASEAPALLRARLHIEFIDVHNQVEAGIDAGGVFKEFLEVLLKEAFSPNYGLFIEAPESGLLFPNPHAAKLFSSEAEALQNFMFLGRVLGKAIFEGVVVDIPFAPFFLNNILGRGNCLDDLRVLDRQQHEALLMLKEMEDAADAFVFFSIEEDVMGEMIETEIVEGGREIQVTNENVVKYLHLVAHHRLVKSTERATSAFVQGLRDLLDRGWLGCFNAHELQQLISGERGVGIDVASLKKHVKLVGGYKEDSRTLQLLWEVLQEFPHEDQGKFLQFCTGSSRPPLLGYGSMNPPFSIRRTEEGSNLNFFVDIDRLPTASTCFNLLKLPPYKNKKNLKDKLTQAIRSGAGFDLS